MIVRELRPDEWRAGRDLRLRALADTPTAFQRTLVEEQAYDEEVWRGRAAADEARCSFVAEENGVLVGSAVGFLEDERDAHLVAMWVDPSQRRRGLGSALAAAVIAWARRRGAARVVLEVNESLTPAVALYERAGFRRTGSGRPLPTDPGRDAIELVLVLE